VRGKEERQTDKYVPLLKRRRRSQLVRKLMEWERIMNEDLEDKLRINPSLVITKISQSRK
jgi:hypothetical protein